MDGHAYSARAVAREPRATAAPARRGPLGPLLLAAGLFAALVAVYGLATQVASFRVRDAKLLWHFTLHASRSLEDTGTTFLHLLNPLPVVLWTIALVAVALARERPRAALAAAAVALLAPLSSEILKPLLAHPHVNFGGVQIGAASYPSGHATAALAIGIAAVIVSPPRARPFVAAAAACFAALIGVVLLVLAWHMPSDVLGGYLMAGLWGALALAALRASGRRSARPVA
jgi:membrane-associated phospholipid phosphatase